MQTHKETLWLRSGIVLFLFLLSLYYFFSEKVTFNNGFGWDGNYYAQLVSNVYDDLAKQKIDSYYIRRILPSILVSIPAHIFNLQITREYIIYGFVIANILLISISIFFWIKICRQFLMSFNRTVVSLILLFGFYWVIKGAAYYPVLTDIFAFSLSIAMLYFYIKDQIHYLAATIFLSFFIWPSTAYIGSFLLLFPKGSYIRIEPRWLNIFTRISYISALGIMGTLITLIIIYDVFWKGLWEASSNPFLIIYLFIGALFAMIYVYYCSKIPIENFEGNVKLLEVKASNAKAIFYWITIIGSCLILQYVFAPIKVTTGLNIQGTLRGSIIKPLLFIVSDITYYGAAALLCILFFRPMLKQLSNLGLGAYLTVLFSLVLNMYPEPRFILNAFPFFVLAISLCGPFDYLTKKQWSILIFTQIIYSKLWLPIGASSKDWDNLLEFPAQFYFLNFGPWMNNTSYVIQSIIGILMIMIFYNNFIVRRNKDEL